MPFPCRLRWGGGSALPTTRHVHPRRVTRRNQTWPHLARCVVLVVDHGQRTRCAHLPIQALDRGSLHTRSVLSSIVGGLRRVFFQEQLSALLLGYQRVPGPSRVREQVLATPRPRRSQASATTLAALRKPGADTQHPRCWMTRRALPGSSKERACSSSPARQGPQHSMRPAPATNANVATQRVPPLNHPTALADSSSLEPIARFQPVAAPLLKVRR